MKTKIGFILTLCMVALAIFFVAIVAIRKNHPTITNLLDAAEGGDLDGVRSLIQQGVPLNQASPAKFGWTPLIGAIFQNQTNIVKYLVEAGADVNFADKNGVTPLMWASRSDEGVPLVALLIDHGANLDATDKLGATVFSYARSLPPKPKLIETLEAAKTNLVRQKNYGNGVAQ